MKKKTNDNPSDPNLVQGGATKDFFITMLIKDITLRDAIGDLVDNAVDAIKAKTTNRDQLIKYSIDIHADPNKLSIFDNGNGIEEQVAKEYAFKLGKPKGHTLAENSIGSVGIGMKRAFFKLGNNIKVESIAPTSRFTISISVNDWKKDEDDWDFKFTSVKTGQNNPHKTTGTRITITDLSEDAKESFKKAQFENELKDEIGREHILNISKGIKLRINKELLKPPPMTLKYATDLIPAYWNSSFDHNGSILKVEIYAGVSDEIESEGGWNIFCNDRLILDRDTTRITGWTGAGNDGVAKYHQQFWGFRGYVFFSAKNSTLLPWNTTKTGIDPDSSDYLAVRKKMIEMMKDVFLLLNRQKKEREKDNPEKKQILNKKIREAKPLSIIEIIKKKGKLSAKFRFPSNFGPVKEKDSKNIKYTVPLVKFNRVKKRLGVTAPSDVGSKTFDYYYEHEVGD